MYPHTHTHTHTHTCTYVCMYVCMYVCTYVSLSQVKDRFCTLLGQQVAKLQEQLAGRAEGEDGDHETAAKKIEDTAPGELV